MEKKLRVGIIGAGVISSYHMNAYQNNPYAQLKAVCAGHIESAKRQADAYGVEKYCTDYLEILDDPEIDAVSIATPTCTHKQMVLDALARGKHVLCEKPPAMNVEEVEECCRAAENADTLLMYGFVRRFSDQLQFMKKYVDSGAMGEIYYADLLRVERCLPVTGWFVEKEKSGGGNLFDGGIHEIDAALYLMGYPKVKSVKGFTSHRNGHLPETMQGIGTYNVASAPFKRTVESVASGYILFENEACIYVKSSSALLAPEESTSISLSGTKAGAKIGYKDIKLVSLDDSGYFIEGSPVIESKTVPFQNQVNHFVDCCLNGTQCICKPWQAVEVMKVLCAIYKSAETGEEIKF